MLVDAIGKKHGNKLGDACQIQISLGGKSISCFSSCEAETVFKVIDRFLDGHAYFVGIVPFFGSTSGSGKGAKIFFRIDIKHTATGGIGTRIFAGSAAPELSILAFLPRHLWTDELECRHAAAKMRAACFRLHWK